MKDKIKMEQVLDNTNIEMEEDESRGAEGEPVKQVGWRSTLLWMLGMVVLFNLVMIPVFYWLLTRHSP